MNISPSLHPSYTIPVPAGSKGLSLSNQTASELTLNTTNWVMTVPAYCIAIHPVGSETGVDVTANPSKPIGDVELDFYSSVVEPSLVPVQNLTVDASGSVSISSGTVDIGTVPAIDVASMPDVTIGNASLTVDTTSNSINDTLYDSAFSVATTSLLATINTELYQNISISIPASSTTPNVNYTVLISWISSNFTILYQHSIGLSNSSGYYVQQFPVYSSTAQIWILTPSSTLTSYCVIYGKRSSSIITINSGTVDVASGTIDIASLPDVTISNAILDIQAGNGVTLPVSGNVDITGGTVDIGTVPAIDVASLPNVTIANASIPVTGSVAISSGTVDIGTVPDIVIQSNASALTVDTSPTPNVETQLYFGSPSLPASTITNVFSAVTDSFEAIFVSILSSLADFQLTIGWYTTTAGAYLLNQTTWSILGTSPFSWTFPVLGPALQLWITTNATAQTLMNMAVYGIRNGGIVNAYQNPNMLSGGYNVSIAANTTIDYYLIPYVGPATLSIQTFSASPISVNLIGVDYLNRQICSIAAFVVAAAPTAGYTQSQMRISLPPLKCVLQLNNDSSGQVIVGWSVIPG